MHVTLVVPAPFHTISGGYAYDRRMVQGLRALGHAVDVCELADHAAPATLPAHALPVIDGLALPAFAANPQMLSTRRCVALIHHPTALETGLSDSERAARQETEQHLLAQAAHVIATSTISAEHLTQAFDVAAERISVVAPGTDEAPRSAGSGGPTCQLLSVGALVPRKGHDILLRALARLFDLDWHLTIVGSKQRDPVHAHGLEASADALGIAGRVTFAGEVGDATLDAQWRRTDLFALATHWEGYGMAVAEALKRGVPVAVTQGGAAGALVTIESGVVCPLDDQPHFSKALRRLIFGNALRRDMAEAAWHVGQTLPDWPTQAKAFEQALAFARGADGDMLAAGREE